MSAGQDTGTPHLDDLHRALARRVSTVRRYHRRNEAVLHHTLALVEAESDYDELLRRAADILRAVGKAALTVKTSLDKPYPDAPGTSPWDQFMGEPARAAYNLGCEIRRALAARTPQPALADPQEAS